MNELLKLSLKYDATIIVVPMVVSGMVDIVMTVENDKENVKTLRVSKLMVESTMGSAFDANVLAAMERALMKKNGEAG